MLNWMSLFNRVPHVTYKNQFHGSFLLLVTADPLASSHEDPNDDTKLVSSSSILRLHGNRKQDQMLIIVCIRICIHEVSLGDQIFLNADEGVL